MIPVPILSAAVGFVLPGALLYIQGIKDPDTTVLIGGINGILAGGLCFVGNIIYPGVRPLIRILGSAFLAYGIVRLKFN